MKNEEISSKLNEEITEIIEYISEHYPSCNLVMFKPKDDDDVISMFKAVIMEVLILKTNYEHSKDLQDFLNIEKDSIERIDNVINTLEKIKIKY